MIFRRLDNMHNYYMTNTHTQQPHTNKETEGGREGWREGVRGESGRGRREGRRRERMSEHIAQKASHLNTSTRL
jgi:hypothetical protein